MPGLKDRLLARIAADGPIPFEVFQHHALYDPDGFFGGDVLRSQKAGDFLTSPEVSPLFGETLAVFVRAELERVGGNRVVDVGAGSGSLLRSMLPVLGTEDRSPRSVGGWDPPGGAGREGASPGEVPPSDRTSHSGNTPIPDRSTGLAGGPTPDRSPRSAGGWDPPGGAGREGGPEVWAVEASPAARTTLGDLIDPAHVVASFDALPDPIEGVVLANELLDNLPVALAIRDGDGWTERWVGEREGELVLVPVDARPEVAAWAEEFGLPCVDGGIVEVQLAAQDWVRAAVGRLGRGALVLVDYGDTSENLAPRRQDGTLRTYRSHHLGPHPLAEPGETDVTVDVNVTAMVAAADEAGASVEVHRQDDFLSELGLRARLSELRHQELVLARDGDPMERLKVRSTRTEAETLLHPRGLGDFRVLVARR